MRPKACHETRIKLLCLFCLKKGSKLRQVKDVAKLVLFLPHYDPETYPTGVCDCCRKTYDAWLVRDDPVLMERLKMKIKDKPHYNEVKRTGGDDCKCVFCHIIVTGSNNFWERKAKKKPVKVTFYCRFIGRVNTIID